MSSVRAVLFNKNTPLLDVEIESGMIIRYGKVKNPDFMPVILQDNLSKETINKWLNGRKIPEKREGLTEARLLCPEFQTYRHMFSLSDQYWFSLHPRDDWAALNFFTNRYPNDAGELFFRPWKADLRSAKRENPDVTTNGVLRKRWIQDEEGTSYLLKAGSKKYHQEPLSEVLATMMLQKLNIIPFVEYDLVIEGMRLCSKCRNFVTKDTEFVPASHIYKKEPDRPGETHYEHLIRMCEIYGVPGARDFINNMIAADYLLCNYDRHLGNFGFIRDVETGKFTGMAPLFDSGSAYWGSSEQVKEHNSKLFKEVEKPIVKRVLKKYHISDAKDVSDMMRLIEIYPEIDETKKRDIITNIERINKGLIQDGKKQEKGIGWPKR